MTTHAPLMNLRILAQHALAVKAVDAGPAVEPTPPSALAEEPVQNREQVRTLVHSLAAAALLACSVCAASAAAAVAVTPLSEEVFSDPDLSVDRHLAALIPLEEWKRYCNRPNALISQASVTYPRGATDYVRDPAYLPVLPLEQPKATTTRRSKKTQTAPHLAPTVARPTTPTVASPRVPTVAAPAVIPPVVAATPAPSRVTPPAGPVTGPVAAPYSTQAPATGPIVSPTSPTPPTDPAGSRQTPSVTPGTTSPGSTGASPSLATQSPAQDGVMASGRGLASDANARTPSPAPTAVTANAGSQTNSGDRRAFIGGQANTLVVPPDGISLQPNNGSGALTAPAHPQ